MSESSAEASVGADGSVPNAPSEGVSSSKADTADQKQRKAEAQAASPESIPKNVLIETGEDVDTEDDSLRGATKADLQKEAQDRGLDDSGTKAELKKRIEEHDAEGVYKPEVLFAYEEE